MVARGGPRSACAVRSSSATAEHPFDLVYQFSSIESFALPRALRAQVPLVIHPETHAAGELRALIAERRLGLRCHPLYRCGASRRDGRAALVQRITIRRARLLVCISSVFRDHLVADYGFPREHTVVVPNPVRLERFEPVEKPLGEPPRVLVLGRVAARKGIEDVVAVANLLTIAAMQCASASSAGRACGRTTRRCSRTCPARAPNTRAAWRPARSPPSSPAATYCCRPATTSPLR